MALSKREEVITVVCDKNDIIDVENRFDCSRMSRLQIKGGQPVDQDIIFWCRETRSVIVKKKGENRLYRSAAGTVPHARYAQSAGSSLIYDDGLPESGKDEAITCPLPEIIKKNGKNID